MHPISQHILDNFIVRKKRAQKDAFIAWLTPQMAQEGYELRVEQDGKSGPRNIVFGDLGTARYVFTAHYDTPATMPIPNFSAPRSFLLTLLYQLLLIGFLFALSYGVSYVLTLLIGNPIAVMLGVVALLVLLMVLMLAGPANPNNYNDNASGVVTVLETALALPAEQRQNAAFVLFDLEELGMVGSSAFKKAHEREMAGKLVVNFDCVSDGDDICFCLTKDAKKNKAVAPLLREAFAATERKTVAVVDKGFFFYPSDQLSFKCAAGVCALKTGRRFKVQYLDRIHTKRDTVFDTRNIELLRDGAVRLAVRES